MSLLFIVLTFTLLTLGQSQEKCRTHSLSAQPRFDIQKYLGIWHPLKFAPAKAHQAARGSPATCLRVNISASGQPNIFNYDEEWYLKMGYGQVNGPHKANGKVSLKPDSPAIWTIDYNISETNENQRAEGVVLATDEKSWAIEYHCAIRSGEIEERLVVLGRRRQVDPFVLKTLDIFMHIYDFPRSHLVDFGQHLCGRF